MKQNYLVLAATVLLLSACAKENSLPQKQMVLSASIEQQENPVETKTTLNGTSVLWSEGDAIKVYMQEGTDFDFTLATGAGETEATFKNPSATGTPEFAIYPSTAAAGISGSTISFNLPAEQTYAENTFADGANVAVAAVGGSSMAFKNVCGVLCLNLKGTIQVDRIELTSNNGEKLNGEFSVDASSSKPAAITGTAANDGEKKITLNCNGVKLNPTTATAFYIVVPTQAFGDAGNPGFTAKVFDVNGDAFFATVSTAKANPINRSKVKLMPTVAATIVPEGYHALTYLASTTSSDGVSNVYLDTGIIPTNSTGFKTRICYMASISKNTSVALMGSRIDKSNSRVMFGVGRGEDGYYVFLGWNTQLSYPPKTSERPDPWEIEVSENYLGDRKLSYNGTVALSDIEVLTLNFSERPFLIFGTWANDGSGEYTKIKGRTYRLYYLIHSENSTLSHYFVPVKCVSGDNEGKLGVLDLVTNNFIMPTGDSKYFVAGPELE